MIPDKSLAEILAHHMRTGIPIPVPLTLSILGQVCNALEYAHNLRDAMGNPLGIVHGDVSPMHIYLSATGTATLVGRTSPQSAFAYMAPELAMTGLQDARADLFALGVVAHEMLANRPLFAGADDRETVDRVCQLPIPPSAAFNPLVAPDLDGIVFMALARDPAYRWQQASMMRDGLWGAAQRLGIDLMAVPPQAWSDLLSMGHSAPASEQVPPQPISPHSGAPTLFGDPAPPPVTSPVAPAAPVAPPGAKTMFGAAEPAPEYAGPSSKTKQVPSVLPPADVDAAPSRPTPLPPILPPVSTAPPAKSFTLSHQSEQTMPAPAYSEGTPSSPIIGRDGDDESEETGTAEPYGKETEPVLAIRNSTLSSPRVGKDSGPAYVHSAPPADAAPPQPIKPAPIAPASIAPAPIAPASIVPASIVPKIAPTRAAPQIAPAPIAPTRATAPLPQLSPLPQRAPMPRITAVPKVAPTPAELTLAEPPRAEPPPAEPPPDEPPPAEPSPEDLPEAEQPRYERMDTAPVVEDEIPVEVDAESPDEGQLPVEVDAESPDEAPPPPPPADPWDDTNEATMFQPLDPAFLEAAAKVAMLNARLAAAKTGTDAKGLPVATPAAPAPADAPAIESTANDAAVRPVARASAPAVTPTSSDDGVRPVARGSKFANTPQSAESAAKVASVNARLAAAARAESNDEGARPIRPPSISVPTSPSSIAQPSEEGIRPVMRGGGAGSADLAEDGVRPVARDSRAEYGVRPVTRTGPVPRPMAPALDPSLAPDLEAALAAELEAARRHPRASAGSIAPPMHAPEPELPPDDEPPPVRFVTSSPVPNEFTPVPPPPNANQVPRGQFEPELGPEPTQIGAMPLISFGDGPLVSSIGQNAPRPAMVMPQGAGTSMPEPTVVKPPRDKRVVMFAIIGAVVVLLIIVIALVAR